MPKTIDDEYDTFEQLIAVDEPEEDDEEDIPLPWDEFEAFDLDEEDSDDLI